MTKHPDGQTNPYTLIRSHSASEQVQEQILSLIADGRLTRRERLPAERDLSSLLGVSRATLREALTSLSDKGVLASKQGNGWFIDLRSDMLIRNIVFHCRLAEVSFSDVATARVILEPSIARIAASVRTLEELREIEAILQETVDAPDTDAFLLRDSDFHEAIARASHNLFFPFALQPALMFLESTRAFAVKDHREAIIRQHTAVFEAIRDQDAGRAEHAMMQHLEHFIELERSRKTPKRSRINAPDDDSAKDFRSSRSARLRSPR